MTDPSTPYDDEDECPDAWHVVDTPADDTCPTCGYRIGGDDD